MAGRSGNPLAQLAREGRNKRGGRTARPHVDGRPVGRPRGGIRDGAVREAVGEARHVIDLFAGCGTFSLPLADQAEVHAVEGDAAMTAALDHGWRMSTGLKPVTTEARDLFRRPLLPDELAKTDAVVIDPPRAGAEAQIAEIVKAMPPVLAYVSCNPVTFARDAAVLIAAGYTLKWVQVVDQFRWSSHVELAAQFTAPEVQRKRK